MKLPILILLPLALLAGDKEDRAMRRDFHRDVERQIQAERQIQKDVEKYTAYCKGQGLVLGYDARHVIACIPPQTAAPKPEPPKPESKPEAKEQK